MSEINDFILNLKNQNRILINQIVLLYNIFVYGLKIVSKDLHTTVYRIVIHTLAHT